MELIKNTLFNNGYYEKGVIPTIIVGVVAYQFNEYCRLNRLIDVQCREEKIIDICKSDDQDYIVSEINCLVKLTDHNYEACRRLANTRVIRSLVSLLERQQQQRNKHLKLTTTKELDTSLLKKVSSSSIESNIIKLIGNIIGQFENVNDIPFDDILNVTYDDDCGFPICILVANMLARYQQSKRNDLKVINVLNAYKVPVLFVKLLKYEVKDEFSTMRKSALSLLKMTDMYYIDRSFGEQERDYALTISRQASSLAAIGKWNRTIDQYRYGYDDILINQCYSGLYVLVCGLFYGWQYTNSIVLTILIGLENWLESIL
ncbi:hypothetical protein DFA_00263 [Cavenderia fasciculata]|uniref:Uncharacterized protein n=1 Tax=Cavenderia fasciculata TaxID=261658 RepID=F4PY25_CACFS|nr:uncharacterized protein DFA_00263 [Cavenderia fasciculata]EGG19685.1 hypothetical protein DFA_00263 [Cavenderia fasciculata]|eukprot:XP_004357979.1 hypothetical protein DFA_00263 [Cavenderia fasciculata]